MNTRLKQGRILIMTTKPSSAQSPPCQCGDDSGPVATIGSRGIFPADLASARSHRDPPMASLSTVTIALIAYAAGFATCLLGVLMVLWLKTL
jgi:hypothetical protein